MNWVQSVRVRRALALAVCLAAVLGVVSAVGFRPGAKPEEVLANPLDRAAFDLLVSWQRTIAARPPANDVIVIGIDERTFGSLQEPFSLWHRHFGMLLRGLADAGAAAVGADIVLPDRLYGFLVPGIDQALLGAMLEVRERLPVVFARTVDSLGAPRTVHPAFVSAAGGDARFGEALLPLDPDGVVRRFEDVDCAEDGRRCTLAGALAAAVGLRHAWQGHIPYMLGEPFEYLPMSEVLRWVQDGAADPLRRVFSNRIVMLGAVLPFEDRLLAPVALHAAEPDHRRVPGVLLHAQVMRGLLNQGLIQQLPWFWIWCAAALAALCWLGSGWKVRAAIFALYALGVIAWAWFELSRGFVVPAGSLVLAAFFASTAGSIVQTIASLRARLRLRQALSGYLNLDVVREIELGRETLRAEARREPVAVLVCRLRDPVRLAEAHDPAALTASLNALAGRIERSVREHGGYLQHMGADVAVALFGVPQSLRAPGRAAMEAAQSLLVAVARLHAQLGPGTTSAGVAIGIAEGMSYVGRVGAAGSERWHALGATLELARDLAAEAVRLDKPVLCSESVAAAVGRPAVLEELPAVSAERPRYAWTPALLERVAAG